MCMITDLPVPASLEIRLTSDVQACRYSGCIHLPLATFSRADSSDPD